jgi:uncharacterized protein (DUF2336 family)
MLLERLSGLASERSSERRVQLLREVTDLFLEGVDLHSHNEMALFDDVLTRIADDVTHSARTELAERVADVGRAPRGLVLRLATDVIAVARSVLRRSLVLTDGDLAEIAEKHSDEHRLAISGRARLAPSVTDILVRRGSARVVERVAENHGARFSKQGYATLIERAAQSEELQVRLAMRRDLDEATLSRLLPALTEKVRLRLSEVGVDALGPASHELAGRLRERIAETDGELREITTLVAGIESGSHDLADIVQKFARGRRSYDLGVMLGMLTGLPRQVTIKAMQRRQVEPILIICRALDLCWDSVEAILAMRASKAGEVYRPSANLRRTYEGLTADAAERAMRLLKVRATAAETAQPA